MTTFEQQVAEALWQAVPAGMGPMPTQEQIIREWLAPRVAAAIRAASPTTASHHESWGLQAALAVLRGDAQ